tara:strand:+ start:253 stop:369 length:117 start_codon:yes stop_codon:yes gene_type:complete
MSRSKWVKPLGLFFGAAIAGGIALVGALIANLIWKNEG